MCGGRDLCGRKNWRGKSGGFARKEELRWRNEFLLEKRKEVVHMEDLGQREGFMLKKLALRREFTQGGNWYGGRNRCKRRNWCRRN